MHGCIGEKPGRSRSIERVSPTLSDAALPVQLASSQYANPACKNPCVRLACKARPHLQPISI